MQAQLKLIVALTVVVTGVAQLAGHSRQTSQFELVPKIVFSSNRTNPTCTTFATALELFLMDPDGTNLQRLTDNEGCTHSDFNAALSPDGKKIVFDGTRDGANTPPGSRLPDGLRRHGAGFVNDGQFSHVVCRQHVCRVSCIKWIGPGADQEPARRPHERQ